MKSELRSAAGQWKARAAAVTAIALTGLLAIGIACSSGGELMASATTPRATATSAASPDSPARTTSTPAPTATSTSISPGAATPVGQATSAAAPLRPTAAVSTPVAVLAATATSGTPTPGEIIAGTFVVGEGSVATFTVNEKLAQLPAPNDAVLKISAITGAIRLDGTKFVISIDLYQLKSDQTRRDQYVREMLFPRQRMTTVTFSLVGDILPAFFKGEQVNANIEAVVNVNGVDAKLKFEIQTRLDGDRLFVLGRTDFVWADFGMRAPSSAIRQVRDNVHVEVLLASKRQSA